MFHVFVEGAKDGTPDGVERLAQAIADHYGMPVDALRTRLASGRFRVKGNTDRATADKYARDLDILGARCTIEEANAGNSRPTPLPFPAVRPATPLPFAAVQPPGRPSQPPGAYASGLAAAFSAEPAPSASLGALEHGDIPLSLSSVDGTDTAPPPDAAFVPPEEPKATVKFVDKKAADAKAPKKEAKPPRPKDEPVDLFIPPEMAEGQGFSVELAPEEEERSARKKAATPPASVPVVAPPADEPPARSSAPAMRRSQPAIPAQEAPAAAPARRGGHPLGDPRVRLVAGVVLAILIGFLPAHLVAAAREKSAFDAIDRKVEAEQELATTPDAYAALDQFRSDMADRKKEERRSIAMLALIMWGALGGAVAYGWFRRIPWERFEQA